MSLNLKYLLVLNGIILAMWTLYTVWSLRETEQQFMKAEVSSIKHLAIGLGLLVEHQIEKNDPVEGLQEEIESLLPHKTGLDIMIIDSSFKVRVATQAGNIGKKWYEEVIKDVLNGKTSPFEVVVTEEDHLSGALNKQLVSHGLFALAMLMIIGLMVNLLTYRIILRPLRVMNNHLKRGTFYAG